MIDLWHEGLERTITVPDKVVPTYLRSGWTEVLTEPVFEPETDGPLEADQNQGD